MFFLSFFFFFFFFLKKKKTRALFLIYVNINFLLLDKGEKIENCLCSFKTEYPIYSLALRGNKLFIGGGKPNQLPILVFFYHYIN